MPRNIEYVGFDENAEYVAFARRRFPQSNYQFLQARVGDAPKFSAPFDLIMANAILRYLDDSEAAALFALAAANLKKNGRFCAYDAVEVEHPHFIAKFLQAHERGNFWRTREQYEKLFAPHFPAGKIEVRDDIYHVPYYMLFLHGTKE